MPAFIRRCRRVVFPRRGHGDMHAPFWFGRACLCHLLGSLAPPARNNRCFKCRNILLCIRWNSPFTPAGIAEFSVGTFTGFCWIRRFFYICPRRRAGGIRSWRLRLSDGWLVPSPGVGIPTSACSEWNDGAQVDAATVVLKLFGVTISYASETR